MGPSPAPTGAERSRSSNAGSACTLPRWMQILLLLLGVCPLAHGQDVAAATYKGDTSKACRASTIPGCLSCEPPPKLYYYPGARPQRCSIACTACRGPNYMLDDEYSQLCHCAPGYGINLGHKDTKYLRYVSPNPRPFGYSRWFRGYEPGYSVQPCGVPSSAARKASGYSPGRRGFRRGWCVGSGFCSPCAPGTTSEGGPPLTTICLPGKDKSPPPLPSPSPPPPLPPPLRPSPPPPSTLGNCSLDISGPGAILPNSPNSNVTEFTINSGPLPTGATGFQCTFTTIPTLAQNLLTQWSTFYLARTSFVPCDGDSCARAQIWVGTTTSPIQTTLTSPGLRRLSTASIPLFIACGYLVGTPPAPPASGSCPGTPLPPTQLTLAAICFPSDAKIRRYNGGTPSLVTMEDLRIGDTVECLKPQDAAGDGVLTSFVPGTCDVYYYINALNAAAQYEYINLAYSAAGGIPAVYRVSPRHGVYTPAASIDPAAPAAAPGVGKVQRAQEVKVGQLLAVRNPAGLYYTAPVTSITRTFQAGAYSPQLTDGGVLVVDDVASVTFGAGSIVSLTRSQPFIFNWYRNTPVWQLFQASAGCSGSTACQCMDDAPTSADSPLGCVRRGQALRDRGLAPSWWHTQVSDVADAAIAAGRTQLDLAGFVQAYRGNITANKVYTWNEGKAMLDAYIKAP